MSCQHMNFFGNFDVFRQTDGDEGPVIGYSAEITIKCQDCGKPFQFLGLQPGVDTHGARVSLDGLEARIAITPQGVEPSPIQRLAFNISRTQ